MHELVINLHIHTTYSDGHGSHAEIAQAALRAGLDAVIVTDHNVYVQGPEDYYSAGERRVLLLVGEEIHNQARQPQKSHLLVLGAGRELAHLAWDIPRLLTNVRQAGGLAFVAHPFDPAAPAVGEGDYSWEDWEINGYTGLELWNGMSEFKSLLKSKFHAIYYAFQPQRIAQGPHPQALARWDELLNQGQRVFAIAGSDAHALPASLGPLQRVLFPYEFHFRTINTHLLADGPLTGNLESDRQLILNSLGRGRAFIGYDLPAATRGFRFTAHGFEQTATLGEEILAQKGITFKIHLPKPAECRLIKDGQVLQSWSSQQNCTYITSQPGTYRVEAYIRYQGRYRGWIFSNPIFVRAPKQLKR